MSMSVRCCRGDIRAVGPRVQPASQRLPRQQAGHLHAGPHAGPVDERDGAAVVVVVDRALRLLRRVRHDLVALPAARVDDRRVQHVRAEVGDVVDDRVRVGGARAASATATTAAAPAVVLGGRVSARSRERSEDRWLLVARRRVADAPALHVWIEICGHYSFGELFCVVWCEGVGRCADRGSLMSFVDCRLCWSVLALAIAIAGSVAVEMSGESIRLLYRVQLT